MIACPQVVTDTGNLTSTGMAAVTVNNVAPVVTAPSDQTATMGIGKSFALGSFSDPGADAPWLVTVKWGDGEPDTTFTHSTPGNLPNKPHTYALEGKYTVAVKVDDGDAIGKDTFRVVVGVKESLIYLPVIMR